MPNDTTTTTTRPVAARDLRTGDRVQLMPDYGFTVVDDPRLIETGWHAGRDQYLLTAHSDGADGPHTSRVNGDAIYRVVVEPETEPERTTTAVRIEIETGTANGRPVPRKALTATLDGIYVFLKRQGFETFARRCQYGERTVMASAAAPIGSVSTGQVPGFAAYLAGAEYLAGAAVRLWIDGERVAVTG